MTIPGPPLTTVTPTPGLSPTHILSPNPSPQGGCQCFSATTASCWWGENHLQHLASARGSGTPEICMGTLCEPTPPWDMGWTNGIPPPPQLHVLTFLWREW